MRSMEEWRERFYCHLGWRLQIDATIIAANHRIGSLATEETGSITIVHTRQKPSSAL